MTIRDQATNRKEANDWWDNYILSTMRMLYLRMYDRDRIYDWFGYENTWKEFIQKGGCRDMPPADFFDCKSKQNMVITINDITRPLVSGRKLGFDLF